MDSLARAVWVLVPAWAARVSRSLGYAIGDGAELNAVPAAGVAIPALALLAGFACARAVPGSDSAFTGSIALTCVMLVVGAAAGGVGFWCVIGFVFGDLSSGHHPYLTHPPTAAAALAVSYGVLFALVVGVPRMARALAASVTPRTWTTPRAVIAALAGGALAYAWSQAAAVLIRPLFVFAGESPPTEAIQPTQTHGEVYALVAALAIGSFAIVRAGLARTPTGSRWVLDAVRARVAAAPVALPWPALALARAAVTTVFLSGLTSGSAESFTLFVVLAAIFALNEFLGTRTAYVRLVSRVPFALRYALSAGAAFALATLIVLPMFGTTQTLAPLLYALLASLVVAAVVFPSTRRTAAVAVAAALLFACVPLPALADNCSGLGDCFTTGQWAAIAAVAIALALLGGFALAAAAAAEGAELAAAAAAAGEAAEAAAAAGEAAEAAAAAGEAAEAAAAAGEAAEGAAAAGEAGEAGAAAAEADAAAGEAGAAEAEAAAGQPAAPGAVQPTSAGGYPDFNPSGCNTNCGACADAVDNALAGNGVNPAASGGADFPTSGGPLQFPVSGAGDIEGALQAAGDGSRGIAYVTDGANAHVFNVVNNGGTVVAIDGQAGVYGTAGEVAGHSGFGGAGVQWGFIPTFPP